MMAKRSRISSEGSPVIVWAMAICAIVALGSVGSFAAKYVLSDGAEAPSSAKSFYFESDMLAESTGAIPQYTLKAGVDMISFSLMNYPDELRSSEVDIDYTVSLAEDGNQVEFISGTIVKGRSSTSVLFEDLVAGTYVVTATATSPYKQTLQGRFTIVSSDNGLSYSVSDGAGSPNLKVTVTTTDYSGDVVISWPSGVLPDNTDPLLKDASGQSYIIQVKPNSEYTFQFFKTNPNADYSDSISVSKS